MRTWMQRNLSMDDLWSVLGYLLIMAVNSVGSRPLGLPVVSLAASGMLAIIWVVNGTIRGRSPSPNLRVAFWAVVAVASALVSALG